MSALPLLDRTVVDDMREYLDAEAMRSLVELFIAESRGYLATIADAVANPGDGELRKRAQRAAHSLKSGAGQIGAAALSAAAGAVESAAAGGGDTFASAVKVLQTCAAETVGALQPLLGG